MNVLVCVPVKPQKNICSNYKLKKKNEETKKQEQKNTFWQFGNEHNFTITRQSGEIVKRKPKSFLY